MLAALNSLETMVRAEGSAAGTDSTGATVSTLAATSASAFARARLHSAALASVCIPT